MHKVTWIDGPFADKLRAIFRDQRVGTPGVARGKRHHRAYFIDFCYRAANCRTRRRPATRELRHPNTRDIEVFVKIAVSRQSAPRDRPTARPASDPIDRKSAV